MKKITWHTFQTTEVEKRKKKNIALFMTTYVSSECLLSGGEVRVEKASLRLSFSIKSKINLC